MSTDSAPVNTKVARDSTIAHARILIVDDLELSCEVLERMLRANGYYNIAVARNGQDAIEQATLMPPDIVILDIQMPVMDGFECCKRLRQMPRHENTPILVQTVLSDLEMRVKAFDCGATDIVIKPVDMGELRARVEVHLQKQYYLRQLQEYHDRTNEELNNARDLQKAILPDAHDIAEMQTRHGLEIASHFRPSSTIGGDFWGIKQVFKNQVACWIVDCSGHGIGAALNAFRLQAYLNEHSPHQSNPGGYLTQMNEKLLELELVGQFATMFYGIIDLRGHTLTYASAGSPPPLIRRKREGIVEQIDATGLPMGLSLHTYPTRTVPFHPGDSILWYSDALIENGLRRGNTTSEATLIEFMEQSHQYSPEDCIDQIIERLDVGAMHQADDDLTLVFCRW